VKEGEGKRERFLIAVTPDDEPQLRAALLRRRLAPLVRTYLGKSRAGA